MMEKLYGAGGGLIPANAPPGYTTGPTSMGIDIERPTQRQHLEKLERLYQEKLAQVRAALKALDENPGVQNVMDLVQRALY